MAAHRGAPPTYVVEWPDIGETAELEWRAWGKTYVAALDHRIADMTFVLGALKEVIGFTRGDERQENLIRHAVALKAERAKLRP